MKVYFETISEQYNLPFLKKGLTVDVNGKKGRVVKADVHGLWAEFEGGKRSKFHPTYKTTYYAINGDIIKDFKE